MNQRVDPRLLQAVIQQESGGNPNAVSPVGAAGIMQIMPDTARDPGFGVTPLQGWDGVDPRTAPVEEQIRFGRDYLAAMQGRFGGDQSLALAAYNAGPGAVEQYGGVPPYRETQNYVQNINAQAPQQASPLEIQWEDSLAPQQNSGLEIQWEDSQLPDVIQSDQAENAAAIQFQHDHPFLRTAGRGARNVAGAVTGAVDLATLPLKTAALGAGIATGSETLQDVGMSPGLRDLTLDAIDDATGDRLKPIGTMDKIGDFASEMVVPLGGAQVATKADSVADIPKMLVNPAGAVETVTRKALPAPLQPEKIARLGFKDVKKAAAKSYKQAEELGGVVKSQGADNFIQKMTRSVDSENERVSRVFKRGPIKDLLDDIQSEYAGKPMTLDDIEALDQKLTKEASRYFSKVDGAKPEYGDIKGIQAALREAVEESVENANLIEGSDEGFQAYKQAVMLYARGKRLEEVDDVVQKAMGQEQPARALRRGFDRLRQRKGFSRYTKEEQEIINTIADETLSSEGMRFLTSRLTGIVGIGSGEPLIGSALAAGSIGARQIEKAGQLSKVNKLETQILKGTGLQRALTPKDLSIFQKRGLNAILNISGKSVATEDISEQLAQ